MRKDNIPKKPLASVARTSALVACVVATSIVVAGLSVNRPALADPVLSSLTLYVNSTDFGGPDIAPGDGVCDAGGTVDFNGAARCTLRAAIEEANAYAANMGATTGQEILITLDPDFAGGTITSTNTTGDYMQTAAASVQAPGSVWFVISAPMTIDLQNKLSTSVSTSVPANVSSTIFAVLSPASNVTIRNASGILGGSTAFVIGAGTKNTTVEGGETYQTTTNQMQRFIVVNNGALGVTFKSYRVGGLAPATTGNTDFNGAVVFAPNGQTSSVTTNVLVEGVDFTSPSTATPGTGNCTTNDGSACVNTAVTVGQGANVNGFEMRSSIVNNLKSHNAAIFNRIFNAYEIGSTGKLAYLNIHDNTFSNNFTSATSVTAALVALPNGYGIGGTSSIVNNRFDNSGTPTQNNGIVWLNAAAGTTPSGMSISDNYFNGFASTDIYTSGAGIVTMERNTFGPNNAGRTGDVAETTAASNVMIANGGTLPNKTNNGIISWMPGTATLDQNCVLSFYVAPQSTGIPGGFTAPVAPVRADIFWTSLKTAEMYLGSTDDLTGSTTIHIPLPPELTKNGQPTGNVRIQTQTFYATTGHLAQQQSSQYSQTQSINGKNITCTPHVVEATDIAPTYGPVAGGNQLTVTGQGFDVQTPTVTFRYGSQNVACDNVSVSNDGTQLTCTVPASPRPGDGTGLVDVIVKSGIRVIGTFTDGYNYGGTKPAGLTSVSPQAGPIEGGTGCSAVGNGFVTPVGGLHFDGASWIDTKIAQGSNITFTVDYSLDAGGNSEGTTIIGAGPPLVSGSLGVSIGAGNILRGVGSVNATLASSIDQGRHTAGFQGGVWSFDGSPKSSVTVGTLGTQMIFVGAAGTGTGGVNPFTGVIYNVRIWNSGVLKRELMPAAWTVAGVTVYGLQDAVSGDLFANQGSGTLTAVTISRATVSIPP
ncbi:MAG: IPT/TIG domain-containing protein, partial [Propionibacteriaceae bacterium]|nr:IPT/TIG domain-containing protein [Propionibacteriaceae bacterium]